MDIVTVTCDRDYYFSLLQAYSINKFLKGKHTHWIIVENSSRPFNEWEKSFRELYTSHSVNIIQGQELILANHLPGYIRQQILKFVISEKITSDYYLLLDSKDILLRPTNISDWGSIEGNNLIYKPPSGSTKINEILAPELQVYARFAFLIQKITGCDIPRWFWAPSTPFRCKTSNVKNILQSLDITSVFDPYITNIKEVSEFILYRFFSDFSDDLGDIPENFWSKGNNTKFLWADIDIEKDLSLIRNEFYKSVSFHRWYIANNAKRIDKITNTLIDDIGLEPNLTIKAFDASYWTMQTMHERGHNLFDQFDIGFRLD